MRRIAEERLTTAAERDQYARAQIRSELVGLVKTGTAQELKDGLTEIANEAMQNNELPRGNAESRDDRGLTLLLLAVCEGKADSVEMLLTHYKTFDPEFDKVERKTFYSNPNSREAKGWNACALAVFHDHKKVCG